MAALSAAAKIGMLSLGVGTAGLMGKITWYLERDLCQIFVFEFDICSMAKYEKVKRVINENEAFRFLKALKISKFDL